MRRLLPEPAGPIEVVDAYHQPLGRHPARPWVILSMIASLDGSTVLDGRSGALSNRTDAAVLRQLRAIADVIIVGASTARLEGYGPPSKEGQRIGVVTAQGSIDIGSDLFTSGAGFVITTEDASFSLPSTVDVVRAGRGTVDLTKALVALDGVAGVGGADRIVQAEGGPSLNAALLAADLVDELALTTSPVTVGGDGPRLTRDGASHVHRFELVHLAVDEDYLYGRWRRRSERTDA